MSRNSAVLAPLLLAAAIASLAAAEKTPLKLDDIYRQESISDFQISPRGDEAVYVRHWYDVNEPGRRTSLWRIDGETGRHEPLEPGEPDGRMPVYSPEGDWLAFVSSRPSQFNPQYDYLIKVPHYSDPSGSVWTIERPQGNPNRQWTRLVQVSSHVQALTDSFYGRIAFHPRGMCYVAGEPTYENALLPPSDSEDQGEGYEDMVQLAFTSNRTPSERIHGIYSSRWWHHAAMNFGMATRNGKLTESPSSASRIDRMTRKASDIASIRIMTSSCLTFQVNGLRTFEQIR